MPSKRGNKRKLKVGLVDADLLDNGTRHPNLVLLKIAGFLKDNQIPFELILDQDADISPYKRIFLSKVFTFTSLPRFYLRAKGTRDEKKFALGGTGFYVNDPIESFKKQRSKDMQSLEKDRYLNKFPNH